MKKKWTAGCATKNLGDLVVGLSRKLTTTPKALPSVAGSVTINPATASKRDGALIDRLPHSAKSYCDQNSLQCFTKKPDGYACSGDEECVNAVCSGQSDTTDVSTSGTCGAAPAATVDSCAGQPGLAEQPRVIALRGFRGSRRAVLGSRTKSHLRVRAPRIDRQRCHITNGRNEARAITGFVYGADGLRKLPLRAGLR
jgi:hypothetical protein